MKKNLAIYCDDSDDDSLEADNRRRINTVKNQRSSRSPLYQTNKSSKFPINLMTVCQTPSESCKQHFEFKSPKYVGLIEKTLLQRLQFYDQKNRDRLCKNQVSSKIKQQQFSIRQLRDKPQINQNSKALFQKVKKERKLSPNVLQRFQTYECQRVSRAAKYELLKTYGIGFQNNTSKCKNIIRELSRSPLKQKSFNRSISKSFEKKTPTNIKKNQNIIGKLIKTNQIRKENLSDKFLLLTPTKTSKEAQKLYQSTFLKNKNNSELTKAQQSILQSITLEQTLYGTLKQKSQHQQMVNKERKQPFAQKKTHLNTKKWKVIT